MSDESFRGNKTTAFDVAVWAAIQRAIDRNHTSRTAVAAKARLAEARLRRISRFEYSMRLEELAAIAEALNTTPFALVIDAAGYTAGGGKLSLTGGD